MMAEEKDQ